MKNILISLSNHMLLIMGTRERLWIALAWIVLAIGLLFRIMHYLSNRSLWLDEAQLARNILERGPLGLLRPLDHHQAAPVLFLQLMDAVTVLFGPSEFAFRLIPLLSSLASLFLFFLIGRIFLDKRYLVILMSIFTFSYSLVYYSQEAKQYSIDVAVALTLIYVFMKVMASDKVTKAHLAVLGISGGISIWLSHPAVFVLAGIGISLLVFIGPKKDRRSLEGLAFIFALWILSFGMNYLLFMRLLKSDATLFSFWDGAFMPAPISISAIKIWGFTLQSFLQFIGYPLQWTVFIAALVAVSIADAIRNRRLDSLSFILTIVVTLVASALHQYPLMPRRGQWPASYGRLILFLAPLLYLLIVRGLQILTEQRRLFISLLLATLLLVPSLHSALSLLNNPILREEMRPVLKYLSNHQKPDDKVYIYYRGHNTVKYYQWYVKLPEHNVHQGVHSIHGNQEQFIQEIEYMKRWPRVWFLFLHRLEDQEILFLSNIEGELLDQYYAPGVSLYLYNFESTGLLKTHVD
jgi:hypothetical protein